MVAFPARFFTMKRFVTLFTLFAGLLTVAEAKSERPNILFVFTDDHAPRAIGAYNGWLKSVNPTPVIDKLAREGMLFEKSFCSNSICGPSRAVILSGKHSHKNGFMNNGNSFDWNQQIFPKILIEMLFLAIYMYTLVIHLMHLFLVQLLLQMMHTDMQKVVLLNIL